MFDAKVNMGGFNRAFDGLEKMLKRPTDFMRRPAEEWMADTEREQFASEGRAGASGQWRELSAAYARRKALERGGLRILERTGAMARALTSLRDVEVTDNKIIFHLPKPAGFHQRGTARMPQRKVVDPSAEQVRRLSERVKREAAEQLEGLGFNARQ